MHETGQYRPTCLKKASNIVCANIFDGRTASVNKSKRKSEEKYIKRKSHVIKYQTYKQYQ